MKWSEIEFDSSYYSHNIFNENEKATKGFLLSQLGVDLENIPEIFFTFSKYLNINEIKIDLIDPIEEKVYLKDVVGTCYKSYANVQWIQAFQRLKNASYWIKINMVSPKKYFSQLKLGTNKQPIPETPISFIKINGKYYIYGNGNHRVTMYKMMYFAEISEKNFHLDCRKISKIQKKIDRKYYLRAMVYTQCK